MTTYSKEFILKHAIAKGNNMSWVQFIKSKEVAEAVADKVWVYLVSNGYVKENKQNRARLVEVRPSEMFTGTWKVRVNRQKSNVAEAALQAGYIPDDLVDQWSAPSPKH